MKVVNPVFWDFTTLEAIQKVKEYIDASSFKTNDKLCVAVNLTPLNWVVITNAIDAHTGQKKVHLDLSYCTTPNGVFDPTPGASAGKAKISKITLPLDAESIVSGINLVPTFKDFTSLNEVSAPSVTSVGDLAFMNCTSLTTVDLPKVKNIGQFAFLNCALATVDFPEATSIGDHAFQNCTNLAEVNLPNATNIGDYAFSGCTDLVTVTLPEATSIGDYAFDGCALETLRIPRVTYIGNSALKNLETGSTDGLFLYLGSTPPNLGTTIVNGGSSVYDRINIRIPTGTNVDSLIGYDFSSYTIPTGQISLSFGGSSKWLQGLFGAGWDTGTVGGGSIMTPSLCSIDYYTP